MESIDLIIGEMNEEYVTQVDKEMAATINSCLLYTSPSPRD